MQFVLIVCYDYPAISAAGVIRTYQLARGLLNLGWQPVILTAQSLMESDHNIETSDGALQCRKTTAAAPQLLRRQISQQQTPQIMKRSLTRTNGRLRHLRRFLASLAVPDGKVAWVYSAVQGGLEIAREHPVHVCFSVSPRPSAHLVAYRLAGQLKIPWVADFALPWSDAPWLVGRPSFIKWLDHRLERLIVRSARHITVAYPDLARSISARHPRVPERPTIIPTGFNEDLFLSPSSPSPHKFTVIYPGNHFCEDGRHGEVFLKAVDAWIHSEPSVKAKIQVVFIGKLDEKLVCQRAQMEHPDVVRVKPLMSHRACVQALLSSHLCVVNTVGHRIPAKVYECMRAGKWILALAEPGSDLASLLRSYSKAISVSPGDLSSIRHALQIRFAQKDSHHSDPVEPDASLERHSSRSAAKTLSQIFENLLQASYRSTTS